MLKRISNFGSCDILHRAAPTGTPPPHPHPAYSTVVPHPTSGSSNIRGHSISWVIRHQGHSTSGSFDIRVIQHQGHSTSMVIQYLGVIQHRRSFNTGVIQHQPHSTSEVIQHRRSFNIIKSLKIYSKSPRKRAGTLPAKFIQIIPRLEEDIFSRWVKNSNANTGCNGGRFVTQLPFSYRFPVSRELSNKPVSGLGAGKRVKRAGNRRMPGDCLGDHPVAPTRAEPVLNPC